MTCMRASRLCFCCSRSMISAICLSSWAISSLRYRLRSFCRSIAACICQFTMSAIAPAATSAPTTPTANSWRLRLRSASRQGNRLILGMSVEAPQRQATGGEKRRGILLDGLGLGLLTHLHLPERIAALRLDADAALDHFGHARDVGAAAANQAQLARLATGSGGKMQLQRAAYLLTHVVDERAQHFRLIVAWQATCLLGAAGPLRGQPVGAHDFLCKLLSAEGEIARVDHF